MSDGLIDGFITCRDRSVRSLFRFRVRIEFPVDGVVAKRNPEEFGRKNEISKKQGSQSNVITTFIKE